MFGDEVRRDVAAEKEGAPPGMAGNTTAVPVDGPHDGLGRPAGAQAANRPGAPGVDADSGMPRTTRDSGNGEFAAFATRLKLAHDAMAAGRAGGTLGEAHGPRVSNLDLLWATWQRDSCS